MHSCWYVQQPKLYLRKNIIWSLCNGTITFCFYFLTAAPWVGRLVDLWSLSRGSPFFIAFGWSSVRWNEFKFSKPFCYNLQDRKNVFQNVVSFYPSACLIVDLLHTWFILLGTGGICADGFKWQLQVTKVRL